MYPFGPGQGSRDAGEKFSLTYSISRKSVTALGNDCGLATRTNWVFTPVKYWKKTSTCCEGYFSLIACCGDDEY